MSRMPYRFSGHESFTFRYAWLPKAVHAMLDTPNVLRDDEQAMIILGLGKNMVRSLRFWIQATGVVLGSKEQGYTLSSFGHELLGEQGYDPFLEDGRTLWLLHWVIATHVDEPLFAWVFLLNHWHQPEILRSEILSAFRREAARLNRTLSETTLEQHFEVFLHTYVATRGPKAGIQEDNLDCPLVELNLIRPIGERKLDGNGRSETIFAFSRDAKPDISSGLFLYCLADYWANQRPHEETLSFHDVALAAGSVGQIFKLPEWNVRERLESLEEDSAGLYSYRESHAVQRVTRRHSMKLPLASIFAR